MRKRDCRALNVEKTHIQRTKKTTVITKSANTDPVNVFNCFVLPSHMLIRNLRGIRYCSVADGKMKIV